MKKAFLAGRGEADITPPAENTELQGQYYQRLSRDCHSPLKAVALLLRSGEEFSALVALDLVGVSGEVSREIQAGAAASVPGLDPERVIVSATHTHNAPAAKKSREWWTPDPRSIGPEAYREIIVRGVAEAFRAAREDLRPARAAAGLGTARLGHCRRALYDDGSAEMYGLTDRPDFVGMEGGEDSGVEMLFLYEDSTLRPLAALVSAACPAQVMEARRRISSDFPGALREMMREEFGPGFTTLYLVGAAGDQSPRDLVRGYRGLEPDSWHEDGVTECAGRLFSAALRAVAAGREKAAADPAFAHLSREMTLPLRRVSAEEYRQASREHARLESSCDLARAYREFCADLLAREGEGGGPGPYDSKLHHFVLMMNAEAVTRRFREQDSLPSVSFRAHALRLGESVFVTNPFELFLEYGQRIRARSRARRTFVVQLANDSLGYLPSPAAEKAGGYGALVINGRVGSDGGRLLVGETLDMISTLFPGRTGPETGHEEK